MGQKKRGRVRPRQDSATRPVRPVPGALLLVLVVAAALRFWHLDSVIGGFHDFNEANYALVARNFSQTSILLPTSDHLFLETPPLYSYVLALIFRATGVSVLAGRLVSVAASLGLVLAVFYLGRRLFEERAGILAATLTAVSPLAVLTGRNIQTDSLLVFLVVAAILFYVRAETGSTADWVRFGLLLDLAIFTKLVAGIALIALVVWESTVNRGRAFRKRQFWLAMAIAAAIPAAFYGYHAFRDLNYSWHEVTGRAVVSTTLPSSLQEWWRLAMEAAWAFSPLIALLVTIGVVTACWRPSREVLLVLVLLVAFTGFYLFVHKHSYYLLTILPFAALLAGRWLASPIPRGLRLAAIGAAGMTGIFFTLVDLTSMKLGFTEYAELGQLSAQLTRDHSLLASREIVDSHGTVLLFYDPAARLATLERLAVGPDGALDVPHSQAQYLLTSVPPDTRSLPAGRLLTRERYGLQIFGWTIAEAHPNANFFQQGKYVFEHSGGPLDFGLRSIRSYSAMALVPIPSTVGLYPTPQGLQLRPKGG
jgi:Gpi18-like mannosyltransferase